VKLLNLIIGVIPKERKIDYIETFREFLGPNYSENKEEFTTIIGNHISWNVKLSY